MPVSPNIFDSSLQSSKKAYRLSCRSLVVLRQLRVVAVRDRSKQEQESAEGTSGEVVSVCWVVSVSSQ